MVIGRRSLAAAGAEELTAVVAGRIALDVARRQQDGRQSLAVQVVEQ